MATITKNNDNIFLYVPNIIGYFRAIFLLLSLWLMPDHPFWCIFCYFISGILDALDGYAARAFNQCSRFGAVLDMVVDRSASACLLLYLGSIYPSWNFCFQVLLALDISSHYMQMYSSLTLGADSHKSVKQNAHPLMKLYYTSRILMFCLCFMSETFLISLYAATTPSFSQVATVLLAITAPGFTIKQVINVVQMIEASRNLAEWELLKGNAKK